MEQRPERTPRLIALMCSLALTMVALHALFAFFLPATTGSIFKRTWGFDAITYFPGWSVAIFYAIAVGVCIAPLNRALRVPAGAALRRLSGTSRTARRIAVAAACATGLVAFCIFHVKYGLLGDNFLRVANIEHGRFVRDEFGTVYLMHLFYAVAHALFGVSADSSVRIFSWCAGAVFILITLDIARDQGTDRFEKIAIALFYLLFGTVQHFFGYLEDYSPILVLILLYFYTSMRSLRGLTSPFVPGGLLALAVAGHLIAVIFVPSFVYVLYRHLNRQKRLGSPLLWIGASLAVVGLIVLFWPNAVFLRLHPLVSHGDGRMTLFSGVRVWEFMNGELLASGGAAFLIAAFSMAVAIRKGICLTPTLRFLLIASACSFAAIFAADEHFGSADWDVYSFPSLAFNLFAILLFLKVFRDQSHAAFKRYAVVILIVFTALHTIPWILVNATDLSIRRAKSTILTDPASYYYPHRATRLLAISFAKNGLQNEAAPLFEKVCLESNDPYHGWGYADFLARSGQPEMALQFIETVVRDFPSYYPALRFQFNMARKLGDENLAFESLRQVYTTYMTTGGDPGREHLAPAFAEYARLLRARGEILAADSVSRTLAAIRAVRTSPIDKPATGTFPVGERR